MAGLRGSIIDSSTGAMGALIDGNSGCSIVSACSTNVGTPGIIFSSLMMASFPTVESAADESTRIFCLQCFPQFVAKVSVWCRVFFHLEVLRCKQQCFSRQIGDDDVLETVISLKID